MYVSNDYFVKYIARSLRTPGIHTQRASSHLTPTPEGRLHTHTHTHTHAHTQIQGDKLSTHTSHPRPKGVFTPHTQHPLGVNARGPSLGLHTSPRSLYYNPVICHTAPLTLHYSNPRLPRPSTC